MSKSKVKWGIIAAGSIANAFAHSIKYSENSELKSVLSLILKSHEFEDVFCT